jgi:hypothetical protein
MNSAQLYLPTLLPQWGIFAGIVLLTIGYVEKKSLWTQLGWIILILTGIAALYFNISGDFNTGEADAAGSRLYSAGWQAVAGGVLASVSLILFQLKKKRYKILAILTLIYFVLTFFLYTGVSGTKGEKTKITAPTAQQQ